MTKLPRRHKRGLMGDINVVPYIDVMLVLLVIFMITAPLLNQGVNVDLPQAKAKVLSAEQEPIIVSVNKRGQYFLNIAAKPSEPITSSQLVEAVQESLTKAKQKGVNRPVLVNGDRAASYGDIVKAMVILQQAGVPNVGLMTQET